jgi:hypothetical protein
VGLVQSDLLLFCSWRTLGVDMRGRSYTMRVNYRMSHQIRSQADRLLPLSLRDIDGNTESRPGTVSVFNGPLPVVEALDNEHGETATVATWLANAARGADRMRSASSSEPRAK